MKLTDIKKALYKQKPTAHFHFIRMGIAYYKTQVFKVQPDDMFRPMVDVHFEIPIKDMGDADFIADMDAKLLNRWIVNE